MCRKLMFTMLLVVAIVSISQLTWAAAAPVDPAGKYAVVGGKTTLGINLVLEGKKYVTLTVTLYDLSLAMLFGTMNFGVEDNLEDGTGGIFDIRAAESEEPTEPPPEPLLKGKWKRTGPTSLKVEADLQELLDQVNGYLGEDMQAVKNPRSYFTGKISSKKGIKTINGKYSLVVDLESTDESFNVKGTSLVFSGSFVAVPAEEVMPTALAVSHAPTISNSGRLSRIKDFAKSLAEQIRQEMLRAGQN